ncbi:MAG: hypothetical protein ACREE6_17910 [Limisphaerales bacterium]
MKKAKKSSFSESAQKFSQKLLDDSERQKTIEEIEKSLKWTGPAAVVGAAAFLIEMAFSANFATLSSTGFGTLCVCFVVLGLSSDLRLAKTVDQLVKRIGDKGDH